MSFDNILKYRSLKAFDNKNRFYPNRIGRTYNLVNGVTTNYRRVFHWSYIYDWDYLKVNYHNVCVMDVFVNNAV